MYAVTAADSRFTPIIELWEERVIACGMTPVIYDLGGLGRGEQVQLRYAQVDVTPRWHRLLAINQAIKALPAPFLYLDPNCILRGQPSKMFASQWDVALTVRPNGRIDTGVLWCNGYDDQLAPFMRAWGEKMATSDDLSDADALCQLIPVIKPGVLYTSLGIRFTLFPARLYNNDGLGVHRSVIVRLQDGEWKDLTRQQLNERCGLWFLKPIDADVYMSFIDDSKLDNKDLLLEPTKPAGIEHVPTVKPGFYTSHPEAVIVACFFNPQNSPYRLLAFQKFYRSIKHMNFRIIECLIGKDAKPQLPKHPSITQVHAESMAWHKETLLNMAVEQLPKEFKYVFILDADVLFTNQNWMIEAVEELQEATVVQPFEYCIHLSKNRLTPDFDVEAYRNLTDDPKTRHPMMWRSFAANFATRPHLTSNKNYDVHGHVGFAWGFRREVLDECPLYEKALIGGADHIIAHAAAGQVPHDCIKKSFTDNLDEVIRWSEMFAVVADGRVDFVPGDLYHIWHGDVANRQYLQRIKDFTADSKNAVKDKGFYRVDRKNAAYMKQYYQRREVHEIDLDGFAGLDADFFEDMGYLLWDILYLFGQPYLDQEVFPDEPTNLFPDFPEAPPPDAPVPGLPAVHAPIQDFAPAVPEQQAEGESSNFS